MYSPRKEKERDASKAYTPSSKPILNVNGLYPWSLLFPPEKKNKRLQKARTKREQRLAQRAAKSARQLSENVRNAFTFAESGDKDSLRTLLKRYLGMDVDLIWQDRKQNANGHSALSIACKNGHVRCAQLLLARKANVNVALCDIGRVSTSLQAVAAAAQQDLCGGVQLLVRYGADVNCKDASDSTPLMNSVASATLSTAQHLLELKADVHYRASTVGDNMNADALHYAMTRFSCKRTPGIAFSLLCCDTDAKNVKINELSVTIGMRDAHIEEYVRVQASIDEYHDTLYLVLSEHAQVDTRLGLGEQMGINNKPLELLFGYLGLSLIKDQIVNKSIDRVGEGGIKRALIPGHLLNAKHWFDKVRFEMFIT
jgi:hypothetical protein